MPRISITALNCQHSCPHPSSSGRTDLLPPYPYLAPKARHEIPNLGASPRAATNLCGFSPEARGTGGRREPNYWGQARSARRSTT
eukprot:scaffold53060_cov29-Tisochrysis_lutea.AAC.4